MGELFIERGNSLRTTGISNVFIDEYMPQAQEECVKVYLYIIRCFSDRAKELSMEAFAKALNMDEESILNGFRYWQEQGLLTVCFDDEGEVKDITIEKLAEITPKDIDNYLSWMEDSQKLSSRTIARRKAAISVMFDYLVNTERKLPHNPVSGAQKVTVEQSEYVTYLKMDEQDKLLDCIRNGTGLTKSMLKYHDRLANRDLAIVFLFLDTGLRVSELASLNVKDIIIHEDLKSPENNEYYIEVLRKGKKKDRKKTRVYFSDESRLYIDNYLDERKRTGEKFTEVSPLFLALSGDRLSIREIQHLVKKYVMAALGRKDISVHKLRSSFAMSFYAAEKDLLVLQSRMGHKSIAATNIYARASEKEQAVKRTMNWRDGAK